MFETFDDYIRTNTSLSQQELETVKQHAIHRKAERREFLLREGEQCRYKIFVVSGLLRSYQVNQDGTESILRFAPEQSWMLDPESYYNNTPSRFHIEALEDSELLLWSPEIMNKLFGLMPSFRSFSDHLIQQTMYINQQRILMNISASSEEKYQEFVERFPNVFGRIPLHMIASYLGVSRETLSRVRHAMVKSSPRG